MRYGAIAFAAILVAGTAGAQAQEISRPALERMGLGSLKNAPAARVQSPGAITYSHAPHQPIVYGQRQRSAYIHQRQNLPRTMWRIAHRSSRFWP